jgi:hypothetical protein
MKKRDVVLLVVGFLVLLLAIGISYSSKVKIIEYKNEFFEIKYDTTWRAKSIKNELDLVHKKSNAKFKVQGKKLDDRYMDTKLVDIIDEILFSIESQNTDYKLINKIYDDNDNYENYSYLYENEMNQVLVSVYKKDNKLIIAYYEAQSEYFDIVLDSVDIMLDSLTIVLGEVN